MSTLLQLAQVPNIGPTGVLERLIEDAREAAQGTQKTLPLTTLFLKSGLSLRGHVIALSEDSGPRSIVLLMQGAQDQAQDLSYVLLSEIAGLAVHNAVNAIEHLSDGRITKPLANAPTPADLHKVAKAVIEEINLLTDGQMTLAVQETGAENSPELLQGLYLTLRDLYSVLKKLAGEELGRRSLEQIGFQFTIRVADVAAVQIKRNACAITVGSGPNGIERVSRDSLRAYLEEAT